MLHINDLLMLIEVEIHVIMGFFPLFFKLMNYRHGSNFDPFS